MIRTARRLGLRSIAVYSEADSEALHVRQADEAHLLGPAPAAESYLRIDRLLEVARRSGADAVHPGYGFLSENADFAAACAEAGVVFVGPPVAAIRAMGSKSEAKAIMEKAGVPLVPGYHGDEQGEARLAAEAERVGYPLLIKASAGGGGKGMRVVERPEDFAAALAAARREAAAAFGDERVLLERYLTRPRHIEVQVFCDGRATRCTSSSATARCSAATRRCWRRHRRRTWTRRGGAEMGRSAVAAATAIGYVGAGTVEFIAEGGAFHFMEMNTRLQVEHPVTEMITGQDLVEWQLRVADGEALPLDQDALSHEGHAFEARLYAEDPQRDFLPATGQLDHLVFPVEGPHLRVDTGVRAGDAVSPHYDPMIAKLVVWDRDRAAALRRLRAALAATEVVGLTTNLAFLSALAAHPAFAAGEVDTGFIERHRAALLPPPEAPTRAVRALACLAEVLRREGEAAATAARSSDPHSPWFGTDGWRLNVETHRSLLFLAGETELPATVHYRGAGLEIEIDGARVAAEGRLGAQGRLDARMDGRQLRATAVWQGDELTLIVDGAAWRLLLFDPLQGAAAEEAAVGSLMAPMPGKVVEIKVTPGTRVERGTALLILEAMKMEHSILAPATGLVSAIHFGEGDLVEEGAELIDFEVEAGAE